LRIESVIEPTDELLIDADQHSYNVFYVPEAVGSASIPAQQDFVVPFGIHSVVGLGGTLPTGDLFALILFSKTHVPRETAALFRTLSLSVKMAVLPVCDTAQTFGVDGAERAESPAVDYSGAMVASAEKLLDLHERMVIEQSALAESRNRELAHLASTDALTGVDNRREFTERLDAEHQRAVRGKTTLGLIMIDIDHFKGYNDRLGHPAGDECLRAIATALAGCINRSTDAIARYGGEEFAAVLPATDPEGVAHLAETMRAAVETLAIPHPQSVSPVVTISLGVVTSNPSVDSTVETLVRIADGALFQAKDGGRNRVVVAADA
jgi:diguanylate cyclase (GGDEF)-like protein